MKKVIFIGGTSYSGSTFFDMILANDSRGFSCGEVHALFHPYREHHYAPLCGCGDKNCKIWDRVKADGERNVYRTIFELNPHVNFIVDSSKDPFWVSRQIEYLQEDNIESRNLLIWKTPTEMIASCEKRGHGKHWAKKWINYHRLYFSLIDHFATCPYQSLVQDPKALKNICDYIGISFFTEKINYWEGLHHTLFGNTSAKIHTRGMGDTHFNNEQTYLEKRANLSAESFKRNFRTIHYDKKSLGDEWERDLSMSSRQIVEILSVLTQHSISSNSLLKPICTEAISKLKMTKFQIFVRRILRRNVLIIKNRLSSTEIRQQ
jgi:hypothetical protein